MARSFSTLAAVVRLPTGDPLASLKSPVVWIRQHHLHKHVVVRRQVETSDVKAEEGEHPPAATSTEKSHEKKKQKNKNKKHWNINEILLQRSGNEKNSCLARSYLLTCPAW